MKFIRYILIIFVAYLAISLTSARIIISYADKSENYLENYLIKNNILDAEIKKINGDWRGLFPSIEVLLDNNTVRKKNKIYPNKIKVDINIYKSIFLLQFVLCYNYFLK